MRFVLAVLGVGAFLSLGCASGQTGNGFPDQDGATGDTPSDLEDAASDAKDGAPVLDSPGDASGDMVPSGPPCRGDDDCQAPDLCTNAQRCRFGHCEVVGGPSLCDDRVACTDDRCDPARGRCVHTPNDARCTGGEFCGGSLGCVRELPCELGDETCARLSGDPCTGTWSCSGARRVCVRSAPFNCDDMDMCTMDVCMVMGTSPGCTHTGPNYMTDPMHCGRCMNRCSAGPHQVTTCAMGMCQSACEPEYVDLDRMAANGCECHTTDADAPDTEFRDTNCDGIDGDAARAIFVSPRGNDMNPGTMMSPKRTLQAAIATAAMASPVRSVYVAAGTYAESVELVGGVSLYGGYDDTMGWRRAMGNSSVIEGGTTAVLAQRLMAPVELQLLEVQSADAMMPGESSYGVRALNSSAMLTLRGVRVTAGAGAPGTDGRDGTMGADGAMGGNGGGNGGGGAGASPCGVAGGAGGSGGNGNRSGARGGDGNGTGAGTVAAIGGAGGAGTGCTDSGCGRPGAD
ncbi:MAG: hypothetical protein HY909_19150, partial [Deltaproteobacteria bacterium]|nr:hypothetical protein [Deltaproteobacteria bacterium]